MNLICAVTLFMLYPLLLALVDSDRPAALEAHIVEQKQFTVIGIQIRTNNAEETAGQGKIPKQWEMFFKNNILGRIPSRADSNIVVVYSNYQSDYKGDYDYLIGAEVRDASDVPAGMVKQIVPAGKYAVVTTPSGQVGKVVSETWRKIWELEDGAQLGGSRAYKKDFEVYDERARDPNNSQVDICLGLK